MATALFIKSVDLKKNSIIDGSTDPDKIMSFLSIAQEIHIQNYLGTKLYESLQASVIAGTLTADEVTLIDDYIQPALIHFAIAEYLPFASYTASNGGIFKRSPENTVQADKSDIDYLVSKEKGYAEYYIQRLVNYLSEYKSLYPLYEANVLNDIRPDKKLSYSSGWRSTGYYYNGEENLDE